MLSSSTMKLRWDVETFTLALVRGRRLSLLNVGKNNCMRMISPLKKRSANYLALRRTCSAVGLPFLLRWSISAPRGVGKWNMRVWKMNPVRSLLTPILVTRRWLRSSLPRDPPRLPYRYHRARMRET